MNKDDISFESWFDIIVTEVKAKTGVQFRDRDSVQAEYNNGDDAYSVADSIVEEYQ